MRAWPSSIRTPTFATKRRCWDEPSADDILWLRQNRLLPLATLFTVDQKSPYYHEENKGSIFYAESWALTHYLEMKDSGRKNSPVSEYLDLLSKQVDSVTAASRAFGDLKQLQQELESYIRNSGFHYLKMMTTTEVDDSAFKVLPLTGAQADAVRADFLAYNSRTADAQALLDHVLQEDPNNVSAHETKGFLEFRQGHLEEAKKWYAQAVQLDSQSYLAHYYFAAMAMNGARDAADQAQVESSLRAAIKLNPSFAPAFDRLAIFLAMRNKNLDEARMMELTAIGLDPANVGYRINMANVWMSMEKGQNAVDVLRFAAKLAKTPQESQMVETALMHAQEYAENQAHFSEQTRRINEEEKSGGGAAVSTTSEGYMPHLSRRPEFVPRGPHRFLVGVLKGVHCDNPALDLTVTSSGKVVALHVDNYFSFPSPLLIFSPTRTSTHAPIWKTGRRKSSMWNRRIRPSLRILISVELHK